uniref:Uncharacterized protein n=1 Tax=Podarcis muralis TaxID=64176 RepID=A0A670HZD3_PODMU
MEQEKSFKLFVPPILNNTQVSAVKPQTSKRDGRCFQVNKNCYFKIYTASLQKLTSVLKSKDYLYFHLSTLKH